MTDQQWTQYGSSSLSLDHSTTWFDQSFVRHSSQGGECSNAVDFPPNRLRRQRLSKSRDRRGISAISHSPSTTYLFTGHRPDSRSFGHRIFTFSSFANCRTWSVSAFWNVLYTFFCDLVVNLLIPWSIIYIYIYKRCFKSLHPISKIHI